MICNNCNKENICREIEIIKNNKICIEFLCNECLIDQTKEYVKIQNEFLTETYNSIKRSMY